MNEPKKVRDWMSGSREETTNVDAPDEQRASKRLMKSEAFWKAWAGTALGPVDRSAESLILRPSVSSPVGKARWTRLRDALGFGGHASLAMPGGGEARRVGRRPGRHTRSAPSRMLYGMIYLTMFMSLGHHADHMIRGNHVGWPLLEYPTPFTYSLGVYPLIVLGLILSRSGRVGPGYWALLSGPGALFLAVVHFGPLAVEPPSDIIGLYESPTIGWFAFAWLVAFIAVLVVTFLYEVNSWLRLRRIGA